MCTDRKENNQRSQPTEGRWPLQDIANIAIIKGVVRKNILRNIVGKIKGAGRGVLHNNMQ